MGHSEATGVTPAGIREGRPDVLRALVAARGAAVLEYCRALTTADVAPRAAAEAFARFRAAVVDAPDLTAVDPDVLLLGATRHAAAAFARTAGAKGREGRLEDFCAAVPGLLAARAAGILGPDEQERLASHLERCPGCRGLAADVERAEIAYREATPGPIPPAAEAMALAALESAAPVLPAAPVPAGQEQLEPEGWDDEAEHQPGADEDLLFEDDAGLEEHHEDWWPEEDDDEARRLLPPLSELPLLRRLRRRRGDQDAEAEPHEPEPGSDPETEGLGQPPLLDDLEVPGPREEPQTAAEPEDPQAPDLAPEPEPELPEPEPLPHELEPVAEAEPEAPTEAWPALEPLGGAEAPEEHEGEHPADDPGHEPARISLQAAMQRRRERQHRDPRALALPVVVVGAALLVTLIASGVFSGDDGQPPVAERRPPELRVEEPVTTPLPVKPVVEPPATEKPRTEGTTTTPQTTTTPGAGEAAPDTGQGAAPQQEAPPQETTPAGDPSGGVTPTVPESPGATQAP